MLRKLIKTLLTGVLCAIVGTLIGMYVQVLLCDVLQLQCIGCR